MKLSNIVSIGLASALLTLTSCFQDLNQDPPFDYPESGGQSYNAKYGENFYMPFEEDPYFVDSVSLNNVLSVGTPGFSGGKFGKAYIGAANSYLQCAVTDLKAPLGNTFSATLWYQIGSGTRAGILTASPVHEGKAANMQNNRTCGFRLFREGSASSQTFKVNVGDGTADTWVDGGAAASLDPTTAGWVHIAMVIDTGKCLLYLNGQLVKESAFAGISWKGCDIISIASGAPRFTEWTHLSDDSKIDELRFYNKALSETEVLNTYNP